VIDFIKRWAKRTGIAVTRFIGWLGIAASKYFDWQSRYGKANEHNALIPRDFWLEEWEKQAIIDFYLKHPLEGYRRLTFMMLDQDVVAVSPSSVYRVLSAADLLRRWSGKASKKGTGFVQPLKAHEHWHIDVSYVNICGTFYYLCSILDGCSRYIVHWELREAMTEKNVEIILQRAREKFPHAAARIISDNGPQFIAKDFKEFIRLAGMTHVRTSPFYPQSNGKLERYHKTIKQECIRPKTPLSLKEAREQLGDYITYYNEERLHSAIGYIAPKDKLEEREKQIFKERDQKLEAARAARKLKRREGKLHPIHQQNASGSQIINPLTQQGQFSISG
jgi:putative transposase